MLLSRLVAVSDEVAATRARSAKVAALAALLTDLPAGEVDAAVAFLVGRPRQGKVGIGWSTLAALDVAPAEVPSLEVADLDAAVATVLAATGPGSGARRPAILAELLAQATPAEGDFIRRLLLGELRQGALEGVMADAVARAAGVPLAAVRRAAMLDGDLARTAAIALHDGGPGLAAVGLELLRPIQPMLASPGSDVATAVTELGTAAVEWKLDGARLQAHRLGDEVRLFTRNRNDVTARLPGVVGLVRGLGVTSVVLDGEVLGVGPDGPEAFQDTMRAFGRDTPDAGGAALDVWFFDCLHLDGTDLLDRPWHERSEALDRTGAPRVPSLVTGDVAAASAFAEGALAAGHEGVVVKAVDAPYEAGRRGAAWRKVKPVHTLDLVVLAAEWGSGRRRGWLSNLHLGARDPGGGTVMVGKTFKGLTDALLTWQTEALLALERGRHGHVVEVKPRLVVEVAVDGVQTSSRYPGGVALRFARVRRYRDDKGPDDADTIDAVRSLR